MDTSLDQAVHVWLLALEHAGPDTWATLAPDEVSRAQRFYFERDRVRWVAARAGLRRVLAAYAGLPPRALRFSYGERGKPSLVREPGAPDLRFNLSHSGTLALVAVTEGRELGVDIEAVRDDRDLQAIAERVFSALELDELNALPPGQRVRGFYNAWSRKEAYIKAHGTGLWLELQSFDVSLAPGRPARLLNTRPEAGEAARWTLADIDVGAGYAAALVVEGSARELLLRRWPSGQA